MTLGSTSLACALALVLAPGEPFLDLSYEQARQRAQDEGKLFLVDATASWCPPCRKMEKEVWPTESVRTWLGEHAVAIQLDVDEQRELAATLKIEAMPTIIAFKAGAEFDRIVGFRSPTDLLAWLDGVLAGKRSGDAVRERAQQLVGSDDVDARYDLAKDLLRQRDYEAAAKEYVWLWKNTRGVSKYGGVRLSFMLSDIHRLCDAHEPAREAFGAIHDELDRKLQTGGSMVYDDWAEWFALGREFDDDARVLAYYQGKHGEDGRLSWAGPRGFLGDYVDEQVFDVLVRHGQFAEAGRLLPDLEAGARKKLMQSRSLAAMEKMLAHGDEGISKIRKQQLQQDLSRFHAAALASGQAEAADAIARMLLDELDDAESRTALVTTAIQAGRAGAQHGTWLDEAEARGADVAALREKLAADGR